MRTIVLRGGSHMTAADKGQAKRNRKGQAGVKKKILNIMITVLLGFPAAVMVFPVLFAFSGVFMSGYELKQYLGPVLAGAEGMARWPLVPHIPTLSPLVELLIDSPQFFVMFWNSVKLTLSILAGQLLVGVPAAWGLARFSFPGRKLLYTLYLVLMLMPFQVLMLPQYIVLERLSLLDTHAGIILPAVFSTFPVFIMYRFFHGIPEAILEAARIDGAGNLRIFLMIGIPLGSAGIVSAMILGFLEYWNMIEQPMTYLKTRAQWPLSLFLPEIGLDEAGTGFTAAVMMLIPALLVFLGGQDYLEQGIAAAAVKE